MFLGKRRSQLPGWGSAATASIFSTVLVADPPKLPNAVLVSAAPTNSGCVIAIFRRYQTATAKQNGCWVFRAAHRTPTAVSVEHPEA